MFVAASLSAELRLSCSGLPRTTTSILEGSKLRCLLTESKLESGQCWQ